MRRKKFNFFFYLKRMKLIFLDLLSFGSPQAIVINLSVILMILSLVSPLALEQGPDISVYRNIIPLIIDDCPESGWFKDCKVPSYGMTRGISSILHGDLAGAYSYNRSVFILFGVMVFLIVVNLVKVVKGYKKRGNLYEF
jgi:hypothetical protein